MLFLVILQLLEEFFRRWTHLICVHLILVQFLLLWKNTSLISWILSFPGAVQKFLPDGWYFNPTSFLGSYVVFHSVARNYLPIYPIPIILPISPLLTAIWQT